MDNETFGKMMAGFGFIGIFIAIMISYLIAPISLFFVVPILVIVFSGIFSVLQKIFVEKRGIIVNKTKQPRIVSNQDLLEDLDSWDESLDKKIAEFIVFNSETNYKKYLDDDFLAEMAIKSKEFRSKMNIKNFDENFFVNSGKVETENLTETEESHKSMANEIWVRYFSNQSRYEYYIEELIEKHKEIRAKLEKILNVSDKIRLDILKDALEMEEKVFNKMIFNWAEDFGFRIDGDYIKIGNADIERFISSLDKQFQNWYKQEKI